MSSPTSTAAGTSRSRHEELAPVPRSAAPATSAVATRGSGAATDFRGSEGGAVQTAPAAGTSTGRAGRPASSRKLEVCAGNRGEPGELTTMRQWESPDHDLASAYSNWRMRSEIHPNTLCVLLKVLGIDPGDVANARIDRIEGRIHPPLGATHPLRQLRTHRDELGARRYVESAGTFFTGRGTSYQRCLSLADSTHHRQSRAPSVYASRSLHRHEAPTPSTNRRPTESRRSAARSGLPDAVWVRR